MVHKTGHEIASCIGFNGYMRHGKESFEGLL
jgi:hypothetical protein